MPSLSIRTAAAAALALAGASAQAQAQGSSVALYGTADGGLYAKQLAGEARTTRIDGGLLTTSRWGLRGSEDLGGGYAAFFDLGSHFRLDTGEPGRNPGDTAAGRFFTRYAFVGLRGGFGQLRLGRIPTGSFVQTLAFTGYGDSTTLGPFMLHTFVGAQPMLASHAGSDGSWNNSIAWNSPAWGGLSAMVQVAAGENGPEGRRLDATLNWRQGPWSAALGHGRIRGASYALPRTRTDPAGAPYVIEQESSTLGSLGYDFGLAHLQLQAADAQLQPRGLPAISLDTLGVNLTVPVGSGRVLASWARTERRQAGAADAERDTLALGYAYALSKRSDLYAVVLHDRASRLASGTGCAVGLRHHF